MEDGYRRHGGDLIAQIVGLSVGCIGYGRSRPLPRTRAPYLTIRRFFLVRLVISITWLIHIGIYLVPLQVGIYPINPFLNDFFASVSSIPFVGISLYALWSFWLLACVVKGTVKVGMRVLFIPIHEMK